MAIASLPGKVVAVTGGFGVLGQAVAATLAGYGARVALADQAPAPPFGAIPAGSWLHGGIDLAQEDATVALMQRILSQAGRLDALVNVAGKFSWEKLEGGALDTWELLHRLNVRTAVVSCKAALPLLLKTGNARIVNIGAMGAIKAGAGMGPYAASKAGVAKLTEALAEELKERRVTVNAVAGRV